MPIMAKESSGEQFSDCPIGVAPAIACDVVDLGEVKTPFKHDKGPKAGQDKWAHQIAIVFQVDAEEVDEATGEATPVRRTDGLMHRLSKYYTLSLSELSNLRKDLDRWRGKAFTDDELSNGWDVENVIGAQCRLNIMLSDKGKPYIESVLPRDRRDPKLVLDPYEREKDRKGGRDVRSPKADGEKPAAAKGGEYDDFKQPEGEGDDSYDLPF